MDSIWTIRRSATDMKLAGLCGGLARHWNVDPVLVRVGWALLALSGGVGVVLYVAGWLLVPLEGRDKAAIDDLLGEQVKRWPREVWVVLVVVASVAVFATLGSVTPFSFGPALVISLVWYFGFYKPRQAKQSHPSSAASISPAPPAAPGPQHAGLSGPTHPAQEAGLVTYSGAPTPFTQAAEAWQRRVQEHVRTAVPPTAGAASGAIPHAPAQPAPVSAGSPRDPEPQWPAPPPPGARSAVSEPDPEEAERIAFLAMPDPAGLYADREPELPATRTKRSASRSARRLRLVSLILVGLALSALGIAESAGATIPPVAYLAVPLLVIGLTLIAATWLGRARGLLPVGVVLALAAVGTSLVHAVEDLPLGSTVSHTYISPAELPLADSLDAGQLRVDLSQLAIREDTAYTAHVDVGSVVVIAPPDVHLVVRYSSDLGSAAVLGREVQAGSDVAGQVHDPAVAPPGEPTLTLDVSADLGSLEVRR